MTPRAVFPLRWRNERLRTLTAEVASRLGISQNELIEQAIEHEVVARGAMLSEDLRAAADRLAELTQEQNELMQARGLESFVAGEGQLEPLQARSAVSPSVADRVAVDRPYLARDVTTIDVTSTLAGITQPNHRHLISVTAGSATHEAILDIDLPSATFGTTGPRSYLRTFGSFLRLGVEHIFTGYDHLAFLVGLLVATSSFRSLIKIVTSFTVAHSITLALATFDAVVLPTRVTESLIALSIGYVAAENLLRSRAIERYRITFLFGLVHGFGFSTVLRQMQLPRRNLALSLFSFNAGVELGQLLFVAIVVPMMMYLAASAWQNRIRSAVSSGIVCVSVYWFIQRAFP